MVQLILVGHEARHVTITVYYLSFYNLAREKADIGIYNTALDGLEEATVTYGSTAG